MAIYAINDAGDASTNIVVNGVNIGNADAGYTTFALALAAASMGDTLVWTGPQVVSGEFTITVDQLVITVADSVRYSTHDFTTGVRVSSILGTVFTFNQAGTLGTFVENLVLEATTGGGDTIVNTGTNVVVVVSCLLKNRNGGAALRSADGPVAVRWSFIEIGDGSRGVTMADNNDSAASASNTICLAAHDGALAAFEGHATPGREVRVGNSYAGDADGITTVAARYLNCIEHANVVEDGYNASSKNDAVGTVTYQSLAAGTLFTDTVVGSYDLNWANLLDSRDYVGGVANTGSDEPDLNNIVRSTGDPWFIGAVTPFLTGNGAGLFHYSAGVLPAGGSFTDVANNSVRGFLLAGFQPNPFWTVPIPFGGWLNKTAPAAQGWVSHNEGQVPGAASVVPSYIDAAQQGGPNTSFYTEGHWPDPSFTVTIPFGGWLVRGVPTLAYTNVLWEGGEISPALAAALFDGAVDERHLVEGFPPVLVVFTDRKSVFMSKALGSILFG